jgi:hypothetical protein
MNTQAEKKLVDVVEQGAKAITSYELKNTNPKSEESALAIADKIDKVEGVLEGDVKTVSENGEEKDSEGSEEQDSESDEENSTNDNEKVNQYLEFWMPKFIDILVDLGIESCAKACFKVIATIVGLFSGCSPVSSSTIATLVATGLDIIINICTGYLNSIAEVDDKISKKLTGKLNKQNDGTHDGSILTDGILDDDINEMKSTQKNDNDLSPKNRDAIHDKVKSEQFSYRASNVTMFPNNKVDTKQDTSPQKAHVEPVNQNPLERFVA